MAGSSSSASSSLDGERKPAYHYQQQEERASTYNASSSSRAPAYIAECMEDRDALRIVAIQLGAERDAQYAMKDIDEESCQRLYRLITNLNTYCVDLLSMHHKEDGRMPGMSPDEVCVWEKSVVHVCVVDVIPGLLRTMMDNSCSMLHYLPILLVSWSSLCARLLSVRMVHGLVCGDAEFVSQTWEEITSCFGILCSCLDESKVEDILYGSDEAYRRNHAVNSSHIVLELEHDERRTDWVNADCRRLPASDAHRVRARFLRACLLDVFASRVAEGYKGGMDYLMDGLKRSSFECTGATCALVSVVHSSCDLLSDGVKQGNAISSTLEDMCSRFEDVLSQPGLSGLVDVPRAVPSVLATFSMMFDITLALGGMEYIRDKISWYEKEIVMRLFESKNVSYQLLAVSSMNDILQDVHRNGNLQGTESNLQGTVSRFGALPSRIEWIKSSNIILEMLKVNLHHAQYIESILALLDGLVHYDIVSDVHTTHLWAMVEDDGTFEDIKSNVSHVIGFLAARMDNACADLFFNKLEATQLSASNIKCIEEMMTSAAKFDQSCRLLNRMIDIGTVFALEKNLPEDVDAHSLMLGLYRRYHRHIHENTMPEYILVMVRVVQSCMSKIMTDSLAMIRAPLCLLLKIFQGDILSSHLISDMYKVVNVDGKMMQTLLHGYESFLLAHAISSCSVLSEDLMDILGIYNDILRCVLSGSNYYVSLHQIALILKWTNNEQYPHLVCDNAWNLLEYMVQKEKGVTFETAQSLVALALRTTSIKNMQYSSWTCITAYAASILSWDSPLSLRDVCFSYMHLIRMTDSNKTMEVWGMLLEFLPACIIRCNNDNIAKECSMLLSHILTSKMDLDGDTEQIKCNVLEYKILLDDCCARLFGTDISNPTSLGSIRMDNVTNPDILKQVQRILTFFQDLLQAYDWRDGPAYRPLYSSFKDEDFAFRVQFQHLPFSPKRYGEHIFVDISCSRNSLIGDLRAKISEKASSLAGYFIPQENFIIYSKGHILRNNVSRLFEYIGEGDEVYASFSSKPDAKYYGSDVTLTSLLSQDISFCCKLLALQDIFLGTTQNSSETEMISQLSLSILLRLPLCIKMGEYIRDALSRMEETKQVDVQLEQISPGLLLYFCLFICSEISPMSIFQRKEDRVSIKSLPMLLDSMILGYTNATDGLRKQLARALTQLLERIREEFPTDDAYLDNAQNFVLRLIEESLDVDSGYSLCDVQYISSTGLTLVLDLSKERAFVAGPILKRLLMSLKDIMRYNCDAIRQIGANIIHMLCQEHHLEDVIFKEIIAGILLSKSPSHEEIQLCTRFVEHMNGQVTSDMIPIAQKICELIDSGLSESQSISGHAKCLQIALLQIGDEELAPMKVLVSRIINTYLFPRNIGFGEGSDEDLRDTYSTAFRDCSYVLAEQDGLYRVLLCGALLFPECWKLIYSTLVDSFQLLEKEFPSLYNNAVVSRLRPFEEYCGLLNGGATCYMNATFQQLFMQPNLRKMLMCSPLEKNPDKVSEVFEALRRVFLQMSGGLGDLVDPSVFWRSFKDYDGNPVDVREHQDAYEFFTRLQDSVDEYLKSLGHEKVMYSVLGGSFIQIIEVPDHENLRSEREEEFYQISVDVRGKKNLIESLESYVAPETLDGENQWHCEELGCKVDAKKKTMLKKLPETLVFHLKRFEWDFETLSRWKIKDRFEFPETIDMEPFVDQPSPDESYLYDLSGIIVHSGTAFAGHYYSYARERSTGKWYLFDDDTVEPWSISNIDNDCFGGLFVPRGSDKQYFRSQSAYMVLYDRRHKESPRHDEYRFLDMLGSIPNELVKEMMSNNLMEMSKLRAFSSGLADFVTRIGAEIEASISGPRASKTQKSESLTREHTAYHNEVFYRGNRREEGYPEAVSEAIILCIEYICRIHAYRPCGPEDASGQGDAAISVLQPLKIACKVPSIAQSVLESCIVSEGNRLSDAMLSVMTSPYKSSRENLRNILGICLQSLMIRGDDICRYFVVDILARIRHELGTHPSVVLRWQDLLGCLSDISVDNACKAILVDHAVDIMMFAQTIYYVWNQLTEDAKEEGGFAFSYLQLMLPLLRMHKLPPENSGGLNDVQKSNPFMIRLSSDSVMREIPSLFPQDDDIAASDIVQYLLLPGYVDLTDTELFMKWFAWENKFRSRVMVRAILGHLQRVSNLKCVASEVAPIVAFLKMEDSYTSFRILEFICGTDDGDDTTGVLDMSMHLEGSVRAYLLAVIMLATRDVYPEIWMTMENNPELEKKLLLWITSVRNVCTQISERIEESATFRENWMDIIPADIEPAIKALFDPCKLFEQFQTFSPALLVNLDTVPSTSHIDQGRKASSSSMTDSIEDKKPLDCIKASDGDDQGYDDDEVREIDIPEP